MTQPGDRIREYTLIREIGQGGMGTVWEVEHEVFGARAMKILDPKWVRESQGVLRFTQEAQIMGRARHPHILVPMEFFEEAGLRIMVMRLMPGGDLYERISTHPQGLPLEEVRGIAIRIQGALMHAHGLGVVHRDVKPRNILFDEEGSPSLCDFGIAKLEGSDLTASRMTIGSPAYMSPEQIKRPKTVDGRSDQYSLGCMIFEMLTGHMVFEEEFRTSEFDLCEAHIRKEAPSPRLLRPDLHPAWESLLKRMMAKLPEERIQEDGELLQLLQALPLEQGRERPIAIQAAHVPTEVEPVAVAAGPARDSSWIRPRRWVLAGAAACGLTLMALGGLSYLPSRVRSGGQPVPNPLPVPVPGPPGPQKEEHWTDCPTCKGKGILSKTEFQPCTTCKGEGALERAVSQMHGECQGTGKKTVQEQVACTGCANGQVTKTKSEDCRTCRGTGERPCSPCAGTGYVHNAWQQTFYCGRCAGTGKRDCTSCEGKGKRDTESTESHRVCNGTGRLVSTRTAVCEGCVNGRITRTEVQNCPACQGSKGESIEQSDTCGTCRGAKRIQV